MGEPAKDVEFFLKEVDENRRELNRLLRKTYE